MITGLVVTPSVAKAFSVIVPSFPGSLIIPVATGEEVLGVVPSNVKKMVAGTLVVRTTESGMPATLCSSDSEIVMLITAIDYI